MGVWVHRDSGLGPNLGGVLETKHKRSNQIVGAFTAQSLIGSPGTLAGTLPDYLSDRADKKKNPEIAAL